MSYEFAEMIRATLIVQRGSCVSCNQLRGILAIDVALRPFFESIEKPENELGDRKSKKAALEMS